LGEDRNINLIVNNLSRTWLLIKKRQSLFINFNNSFSLTMNIFVAKLSSDTKGEDLQGLFETYGRVDSAKVIIDRDTNQSKGFGFVEMPEDREAQAAIDELNETDFKGSRIVVKKARPRTEGPAEGPRRPNPRFNR
jgi:RNA recognition motif-containing protein